MSIAVLIQTYDEVRRLAIAGSVVAPGDFRLEKLVPQLELAGRKAPVFAKVAEAVGKLIASNEKTSAEALLEVAMLINAILYTQGETGLAGEMTPIQTIDLGRARSQASARVLKPLHEALTTTGGGRLEIIRDAYQNGICHDFRLIGPALTALDDSYSEIADLVAQKILPLYGSAIMPELQARFDPRGKGGHVRRLLLMHQLDPDAARPIVQRALDEGTKEMRVAAISCLGASEDLPFLLEQAKAKANEVRSAAYKALGRTADDAAVKILCQAIEGEDLALAEEPLRDSRHPAITALLHETVSKEFEIVRKPKGDSKEIQKATGRYCQLLACLKYREDEATGKLLLRLFDQFKNLPVAIGESLVVVMSVGPRAVQSALVEKHDLLPPGLLGTAFLAATRSRSPEEVFDLFSPYFTARVNEKKKDKDPAYAKREELIRLITWRHMHEDPSMLDNLDPRWLDLAVQVRHTDLLRTLVRPGHVAAMALLADFFHEHMSERKNPGAFLEAMIRVKHPEATDAAIAFIQMEAKEANPQLWHWHTQILSQLPRAEAYPKLEALLPTLPEKIADLVVTAMAEMK